MNYLCIRTGHNRHFSTLLSPHPFRILLCFFPMLLWPFSLPPRLTPLPSVLRHLSSRCLSSRSKLGTASWKSHVLWKICFPISLPATSRLGRPISCGKFVFPSHYLPLPILDVPSPVVNSPSHPTTCHFPSWTFMFSWKSQDSCQLWSNIPISSIKKMEKYLPVRSAHNSHVMRIKKTIAKLMHKSHVMCQKTSAKSAAKCRAICTYYSILNLLYDAQTWLRGRKRHLSNQPGSLQGDVFSPSFFQRWLGRRDECMETTLWMSWCQHRT